MANGNRLDRNGLSRVLSKIKALFATKQDTLVSGTNLKTINNTSLLGSGNIDVSGGGTDVFVVRYNVTTYAEIQQALENGKILFVGLMPVICVNKTDTYITLYATSQTQDQSSFNITEMKVSNANIWSYNHFSYAGLYYVNNKLSTKANTSDLPGLATDSVAGTIKLNPSKSITLNSDGQLEVGGRIGQFSGTTGLFAPDNRAPRNVGDYSFLITDAMGMDLNTSRAFALVSGLGVTCKSAAAGSTEYRVTNNYNNRIICKAAENGYVSLSEAKSNVERIVPIVSVTINGSSFTPDSSANSSNDIVIKTEETLNPDSATTSIRIFPVMKSYSTAHIGNGIASWGGGRNFLLGGGVIKDGSSNDDCLVGNGIYCTGNGNAAFGRYHIVRKNRGFFAGQGHDSTNAANEGVSALGSYSYIDANTLFAVGNGSSHTARINAFEVLKDSSIVLRSPNGTRYKIAVSDAGVITATAI